MSGQNRSLQGRALYWVLLEGNRLAIAAGIAVGTFLLVFSLAVLDVVTLGYESSIRSLLSSGIASGLLTLVTVALSINQLILSRVFGTPDELTDRYASSLDLRAALEAVADEASTPNDPAAFVAMAGEALRDHAVALRETEAPDEGARAALDETADDVEAYAERFSEFDGAETNTSDVLMALLGGAYAEHVTETRRVQTEHGSRLSEAAHEQLDAVLESLRIVAVTRQYLKTLAIQQELARVSRLVAFSGLAAFLTTVGLTLVYKAGTGAVLPASILPPLASVGLAVIVTPLAILIVYTVRLATIARYTVSAGPFIPPEERGPKE